jgi:hypothetical protein
VWLIFKDSLYSGKYGKCNMIAKMLLFSWYAENHIRKLELPRHGRSFYWLNKIPKALMCF